MWKEEKTSRTPLRRRPERVATATCAPRGRCQPRPSLLGTSPNRNDSSSECTMSRWRRAEEGDGRPLLQECRDGRTVGERGHLEENIILGCVEAHLATSGYLFQEDLQCSDGASDRVSHQTGGPGAPRQSESATPPGPSIVRWQPCSVPNHRTRWLFQHATPVFCRVLWLVLHPLPSLAELLFGTRGTIHARRESRELPGSNFFSFPCAAFFFPHTPAQNKDQTETGPRPPHSPPKRQDQGRLARAGVPHTTDATWRACASSLHASSFNVVIQGFSELQDGILDISAS